ncbi:MAG: TetR/AcrR family transcriptional regulator [Pseudomonadota bacterium]
MPRAKSYDPTVVTTAAMHRFWVHGYNGSAISDLVHATGISRHGLYQTFEDKRGLFAAAAAQYVTEVVTPALNRVERPGADVQDILAYFRQQIALAETHGLPGPGCLMANTMTETGPHDPKVAELVRAHLQRLTSAFRNALTPSVDAASLDEAAWFVTVSAQGLWSVSRTVETVTPLYSFVDQLMACFERNTG